MALPALLGAGAKAIGGSIVKGAAKKKTAVSAQKLLPQSKSAGAITPIKKSNVTSITPIEIKKPDVSSANEGGEGKEDTLVVIKERCIEIDTLLKGSLALEKIRDEQSRKKSEKKERAEGEKELEKTDDKEKKKGKGLKLPKVSFFDRIKKFITTTLLGFIVVKLIEFTPILTDFLETIKPVAKFIFDVGKTLLDGLVTLVDEGYKLYDSGRKFIGDKLGEDVLKEFDKFSGAVNTMLNLALIAAMAGAGGLGRGRKPKQPKPDGPKKSPKPGQGIDAKSGRPRKPKANEIIDPDGKIRAKKGSETKLKNMGLDDDQIRAYNKARAGGANRPQAMAQARRVKPKPPPKRGFFGRLGQGLSDFGRDARELATKGVKALGGGLDYLSGGNLGKLGNLLKDQYKNASKFARGQFDKVTAVAKRLKGKFGSALNSVKSAIGNLGKEAQKRLIQPLLDKLTPLLKPLTDKVKSIGKGIMGLLSKIPGFNNVDKVLRKKGINGITDFKGIIKKVGPKAIDIIGAIFNLLFAYDRLATGDSTGALIEFVSAGFDLLPLVAGPAGAFGPRVSMGIDAFMFARDFIPAIQEKETEIINGMGLGGLKTNLDSVGSKLPDLSTIVKMFTGGDPEKPILEGDKDETPPPPIVMGGVAADRMGEGTGANVTGATGKGMQTGPAGYDRIGAGAAYHVDTKFHKSIGMNGMIAAMDKLADAYTARDKEIVFSGSGYGYGKAYKSDLDPEEKKKLMQSAIDAHSHSQFMRAEGFLPFDYYIPDIAANKNLYHPSTEQAEILLPQMGGEIKVGSVYSGYGKSAEIFDAAGKMVAMTGHGDLAYSKGGFTKSGAHKITVGEQGREFVLDADSTAAIEAAFPGLLSAANKAKGSAAIGALRSFASYDMPEVIPIPVPQGAAPQQNSYGSMNKGSTTITLLPTKEAFSDILYMR